MLDGEMGEAVQLAAEVVVKVAEALGAERLVPVKNAHVSGISFKNIGEAGLDFLKSLASKNAKFTVPTTINPAGFDLKKWREMNVDDDFFVKQHEIISSLVKMGAEPILSCTPYEIKTPKYGQHIAWSESNAVLYANSILGARTNREGGPLAIFEGIIGRAPYVGLHLRENRLPRLLVKVSDIPKGSSAALIGYTLGMIVETGVPYVESPVFLKDPKDVKLFLAAVGASSSIGLVLIEGVSPEASIYREEIEKTNVKKIEITEGDLEDALSRISGELDNVDAFLMGCPHLSLKELLEVRDFLESKRVEERLILFTSRNVIEKSGRVVQELKNKGVEIYADTCMVVSDLNRLGVKSVALDSAKAAYYLTAQGYETVLLTREEILKKVSGE